MPSIYPSSHVLQVCCPIGQPKQALKRDQNCTCLHHIASCHVRANNWHTGRGTPAAVLTAIVDLPGHLAIGLRTATVATVSRSTPTPTDAADPQTPGATNPDSRLAAMAFVTPYLVFSLHAGPRHC